MLSSSCRLSAVKSCNAFATSSGAKGVLEGGVEGGDKAASTACGSGMGNGGVKGKFGVNKTRYNSASVSGDKLWLVLPAGAGVLASSQHSGSAVFMVKLRGVARGEAFSKLNCFQAVEGPNTFGEVVVALWVLLLACMVRKTPFMQPCHSHASGVMIYHCHIQQKASDATL